MSMIFGKLFGNLSIIVCASVGAAAANAAAYTDTVQAPTGFFLPVSAGPYDSPYYRDAGQDWSWQHGAIATPFTTATLNISAFDVDAPFEIDTIYAYDDGVRTLIGNLTGTDNTYSFTSFVLGSNFFNDIAAGLKVDVDIDSQNTGWVLTLVKSAVSVDGGALPPPTPGGAVPEPASWAMFIGGFGMIGGALRSRRRATAILA
jgi:hypothetical protein